VAKMKKYKVAIYIRVSTKRQVEEGVSLSAQRERLEKMCETNGYIIYKIYADEGKSGKDTNRPAFQEMMADMRKGKFDKILVMKLDRITRSVIDLEIMVKEMQEHNVHFQTASGDIDTSTPYGMMFIRLLAIFAQLERDLITERINDAFEEMVSEGKPISGSQPLGYKIENGKVVIDEEKRDIVNDLFDVYEKTHAQKRAIVYVNEKYGSHIKLQNFSNMIRQTHYYGSYRDNDSYCPPYMTKERWDRIQQIKKAGKGVKTAHPDRFFLFSGLLVDVHCNTKLAGRCKPNPTNDTYYYNCNKHLSSSLCISNKVVNESWLEKYLLNNLDECINEYFNSLDKEYEKYEVVDNTKEIAKLKEELRRTTISFNKGRMEEDEYDKEYEKIKKRLEKLQQAPVKKDTTNLKELVGMEWQTMYNELDREHKQMWWRNVIDKIVIDPLNYKEGKEYIQVYFL
jgi:DNA invertase Pin-like site-specific DNA recombinase